MTGTAPNRLGIRRDDAAVTGIRVLRGVRKLDSAAAAAAAASAAGAPFVEWKWGNGWQCRMNEALDVTTVDNMSATRSAQRRSQGANHMLWEPHGFFLSMTVYTCTVYVDNTGHSSQHRRPSAKYCNKKTQKVTFSDLTLFSEM